MKMNHKLLFLIAIIFTLFYTTASAQIKAVTERGDTIYVYDNGTWAFSDDEEMPALNDELGFLSMELKFDTIATPFKVLKTAKKEINSRLEFFKIKYDDKIWKRVPPANINPDAEIALMSKDNSLFAMVISEGMEIGMENIVKVAINNMEKVTNEKVNIIQLEHRMVNEQEVLRGVYNLSLNGMDFIFETYYFSSEKGTVQFSAWTGANIYEKNPEVLSDLLNGLIIN